MRMSVRRVQVYSQLQRAPCSPPLVAVKRKTPEEVWLLPQRALAGEDAGPELSYSLQGEFFSVPMFPYRLRVPGSGSQEDVYGELLRLGAQFSSLAIRFAEANAVSPRQVLILFSEIFKRSDHGILVYAGCGCCENG